MMLTYVIVYYVVVYEERDSPFMVARVGNIPLRWSQVLGK